MRQSTDIADNQHVSFGMNCSSVHHSSMSVAFMTGVTLFVFGSLVIEVAYVQNLGQLILMGNVMDGQMVSPASFHYNTSQRV